MVLETSELVIDNRTQAINQIKMKYLLTTVAGILLIVGIGCVNIEAAKDAKCTENVIEFKNVVVEIPEMEEFELTSFHRLNNHMLIAHKKDNVGIDVQITEESEEEFAKTKKSLYGDPGNLMIFGDGNKFKLEILDEDELIGNTRYIYVYRNANYTVTFTQYDYTDGKWDEKVADIIDSISIKPRKGGD